MNVIELFQSFQNQEQAVEYLEKVRWGDRPFCPYCMSHSVGRHASGDRKLARWQCRDCTRAFAVTVGTLFHGTHVPLRNWFLTLALMLNGQKSASAYQISRDLGMRRATVWSMMHRIRTAMAADPEQERLLHGIVEAGEAHFGGKPRRDNKRSEGASKKRGPGRVEKVAVVGAVERSVRIIASSGHSGKEIFKFMARFVDQCASKTMFNDNMRMFVGAVA